MGEGERASVLVADRSPEDVGRVAGALDRAAFRTTTALSGREALASLEREPSQVLLLGLALPDMPAMSVLQAAQRRDPNVTGVVLASPGAEDAAADCMRQGAFDFVVKTTGLRYLDPVVARAARHYRLQSALSERTQQLERMGAEFSARLAAGIAGRGAQGDEQLRQLLAQMQELDECRNRYMADLAHELKNPMTVIAGYSEVLLGPRAEQLPELARRGLSAIAANAEQVLRLVSGLGELAALQTEKVRLEFESVPVDELLRQVAESFGLPAEQKSIRLHTLCLGEDRLAVRADLGRLRQVLWNLLFNALKFTPPGGRVSVRVWGEAAQAPGEGQVHFCVEDTGMGIPAEECGRVFERSYQVPTGVARQGMGLGLEISRRLVELHGGRIWAESDVGHGARFHFLIPATQESPDPGKFVAPPITAIRRTR